MQMILIVPSSVRTITLMRLRSLVKPSTWRTFGSASRGGFVIVRGGTHECLGVQEHATLHGRYLIFRARGSVRENRCGRIGSQDAPRVDWRAPATEGNELPFGQDEHGNRQNWWARRFVRTNGNGAGAAAAVSRRKANTAARVSRMIPHSRICNSQASHAAQPGCPDREPERKKGGMNGMEKQGYRGSGEVNRSD